MNGPTGSAPFHPLTLAADTCRHAKEAAITTATHRVGHLQNRQEASGGLAKSRPPTNARLSRKQPHGIQAAGHEADGGEAALSARLQRS